MTCFYVNKEVCKFERYKTMANNMTIGPALIVGGNKVEMTTTGKVQVTNQEGKIKTLSQDQFKKQLIKNADKISDGENVEFKKDSKAGLIVGGAIATAAVVTAVVFRKDIAKYMKDFSFKKLGQDIKGLFGKAKNKISGLFHKTPKEPAKLNAVVDLENKKALDFAREFNIQNQPGSPYLQARTQMIEDARAAFAGYTPEMEAAALARAAANKVK